MRKPTYLLAAVGFAFAGWLLACANVKAQTTSTPDPHWTVRGVPERSPVTRCGPLQDFSKDAKPFEYDGDLSVPRRLTVAQGGVVEESVKTERVGEIMGFAIYEVLYHIEYPVNKDDPTFDFSQSPTFIKMILVQRKPGEYCEIFNDQGMEALVFGHEDPYIVNVESQLVLATRDPVNGNCGCFDEAYWTFDKDGPVFLDTSIISETEQETAPAGFFDTHGGDFDLKALTYSRFLHNKDGDGGNVSIKFALKDHKLVVVDKKFE